LHRLDGLTQFGEGNQERGADLSGLVTGGRVRVPQRLSAHTD
jgi:hypothetical protein